LFFRESTANLAMWEDDDRNGSNVALQYLIAADNRSGNRSARGLLPIEGSPLKEAGQEIENTGEEPKISSVCPKTPDFGLM